MPDTIKEVGSCQKKCKAPSEVPFHTLLNPPAACKWLWISQFLRFIGVHENRDRSGVLMASVALILYMSEIVNQPESTTSNLDQWENIYVY